MSKNRHCPYFRQLMDGVRMLVIIGIMDIRAKICRAAASYNKRLCGRYHRKEIIHYTKAEKRLVRACELYEKEEDIIEEYLERYGLV